MLFCDLLLLIHIPHYVSYMDNLSAFLAITPTVFLSILLSIGLLWIKLALFIEVKMSKGYPNHHKFVKMDKRQNTPYQNCHPSPHFLQKILPQSCKKSTANKKTCPGGQVLSEVLLLSDLIIMYLMRSARL